MNVEQLYKELFAEIHTVTESFDLMHQLDALSQSLFNTKMTLEQKLDLYLEFSIKNNLLMLMEKSGIDMNDANAIEKFIAELKKRVKEIPVFEFEIAYEPNSNTIKHVAEWIYFNLQQNVLLDVKINPDLIAGAIIGFRGKMGDFSLKKKIEERYGFATVPAGGPVAKNQNSNTPT
jgi:F0F1-type ATP synthase delta subunit